jgi:hypothetical protein
MHCPYGQTKPQLGLCQDEYQPLPRRRGLRKTGAIDRCTWTDTVEDGTAVSFYLTTFAPETSYEVTGRAPYLGQTRAWIGNATWKRLDCATVEVLVGGKV